MSNPNKPPKELTLEEMEKLLGDKPKKKSRSKTSKKPPPKQPSVAKTAKEEVPTEMCFMDIHFWLRDGDLFGTVCNDARDEKQFRGPGVLIFAHDHARNIECSNNCKEIR